MKYLKYILTMCGFLLMAAACTDQDVPTVDQPTDSWVMSRTAGSGEIRMVGTPKKKGGTPFDEVIEFDNNGKGSWKDGQGPVWEEGQVFDLYAISPVTEPTDDVVDASVAYQMQFWSDRMRSSDSKENRPREFNLKHLHGQLKVHIAVHESSNEEHMPQEVKIRLYQQGRINYPNEKLEPAGDLGWIALTGWQHEGSWSVGTTETAEEDHPWVMKDPILIIPQDLVLDGKPIVTFQLEDQKYGTAKYEFIPSTPMKLKAGKLTHLYLGITFTKQEPDDEEEGGEETLNPVITVEGITVTEWETAGEPTNGTATPL